MKNGELELTVPGCLRAPLLSNTETIKWRTVYVPIPIIRKYRMAKGLSITFVPSNRFGQRYIDTCRQKQQISSRSPNSTSPEQACSGNSYRQLSVSTIGFDITRYMSIQYWPNNRSMKVSIDAGHNKLQKVPIDTYHKQQQASCWNRILSIVYRPGTYFPGCTECAVVSRFALAAVYTAVSSGLLCSSSTVSSRVCCCINYSSDINS